MMPSSHANTNFFSGAMDSRCDDHGAMKDSPSRLPVCNQLYHHLELQLSASPYRQTEIRPPIKTIYKVDIGAERIHTDNLHPGMQCTMYFYFRRMSSSLDCWPLRIAPSHM